MSNKEAKTPVSLSVMSGGREDFEISNGKTYSIKAMAIAHVEEFLKDNINLGSQFFNFTDKKELKLMDKWLGEVSVEIDDTVVAAKYCLDENGEIMTVKKCMKDGWDVKDFRNYLRKLIDISG